MSILPRRVNPLSLSLSHLPLLPVLAASFSRVARCSSVESRAVERFLGHYSRFSGLWTDETRGEDGAKGEGEYLFGGTEAVYYLLPE